MKRKHLRSVFLNFRNSKRNCIIDILNLITIYVLNNRKLNPPDNKTTIAHSNITLLLNICFAQNISTNNVLETLKTHIRFYVISKPHSYNVTTVLREKSNN